MSIDESGIYSNATYSVCVPNVQRHRFSPNIRVYLENWEPIPDDRVLKGRIVGDNPVSARPKSITMRLETSNDPLWISAQELQTSKQVFGWMDRIAAQLGCEIEVIGKSVEGRPLRVLKIGNLQSKEMIMVLSRQHPPEVTGYLAMKAFVETVASQSELARPFRTSNRAIKQRRQSYQPAHRRDTFMWLTKWKP